MNTRIVTSLGIALILVVGVIATMLLLGISATTRVNASQVTTGTPLAVAEGTCVPPPTGLVSWWPGDGNANDIVGGNDGALQGGATFAAGQVAQSLSFDGVDDLVIVPDSSGLRPAFITVDAWVKVGSIPDGVATHVIERADGTIGEGYNMAVGTTDPQFTVITDTGVFVVFGTTNIVASGQFHHLAGTFDGSNVKIYVDGVLESSASASGSIDYVSTLDLVFGGQQPPSAGTFRRFKGLIDEVEIFDRAC